MDKKTKMWLGAGIVGVGAYLLWKSKKSATPSLTAAPAASATPTATSNLVGFDSGKFFEPETAKYGQDTGVFANSNGPEKMEKDFFSVNEGQFVNGNGWNPFRRKKPKLKGSVEIGEGYATGEQGEFVTFANQPFNFAGTDNDPVGQRKMPFADKVGDNEKFNAGGPLKGNFKSALGGRDASFYDSERVPFKPNQGVFKPQPKRKSPVEPDMPIKEVTQAAPLNNMVGADGGFFDVQSGFGK